MPRPSPLTHPKMIAARHASNKPIRPEELARYGLPGPMKEAVVRMYPMSARIITHFAKELRVPRKIAAHLITTMALERLAEISKEKGLKPLPMESFIQEKDYITRGYARNFRDRVAEARAELDALRAKP